MMKTMTQVITLLMLKRLHVDPLTMKLVVRKCQKTRVGFYVQKGPCLPLHPSLYHDDIGLCSLILKYAQPLILTSAAFPQSVFSFSRLTAVPRFPFHHVHVRLYLLLLLVAFVKNLRLLKFIVIFL